MPSPTRDELVDLIAVKIPYVTTEFGHYTAMRILQHLEENGLMVVSTEPSVVQVNAGVDSDDMQTGFERVKHIYRAMVEVSPYRKIRVPDSSPFVPKAKSELAAEPMIEFVGPHLTVPEECLFPEPLVGFDAGDGSRD